MRTLRTGWSLARFSRFLWLCIHLRSVSRARFVDAYENHIPNHGK